MYNCSVFQLKNCSLRSCRELAICTCEGSQKNGDSSENILHNGKNTAVGGFAKKLRVGYVYVLSVYICTFCIADGDLVGCSFR
jgi:hypothetical protein